MSKSRDIIDAREHLYRILFAIEMFEVYKKSYMKPKDFDTYLNNLKLEQEQLIYNLKNNDTTASITKPL